MSQSLQRLAADRVLLSNMPCRLSNGCSSFVGLTDDQYCFKDAYSEGRMLGKWRTFQTRVSGKASASDNLYLFPILINGQIVKKRDDVFSSSLMESLSSHYAMHIEKVTLDSLVEMSLKEHCVVVSAIEINDAILSKCSSETWSCLKRLFQAADVMLWVSAAGTRGINDPEYGTTMGLFRVLAVEEPSLRATYILVEDIQLHRENTIRNLIAVVQRTEEGDADKEHIQRDGLLHCSRL